VEAIQGTVGYVIPPPGYFESSSQYWKRADMLVDDEIKWASSRRKVLGDRKLQCKTRRNVFGKALTNGLNPIAGLWHARTYQPELFPPGSTTRRSRPNPLAPP